MKKAFTLFALMMISLAGIAAEYVAYQPTAPVAISWDSNSWDGSYYDTSERSSDGSFVSLSADDVIKIHVTGVVGTIGTDCAAAISFKPHDYDWTNITSYATVNLAQGVITVTVADGSGKYTPSGGSETNVNWTAAEMATAIKERGLVISGIRFKLLDITVSTNTISSAAQTFFTGESHDLGTWTWENRIALLPWTYNLAKMKAGDVLKIGYTVYSTLGEGEDGQMQVTDGTTEIGNIGNITTAGATGTLSITLTNEMISQLNAGNTRIVGTHVYVNSMTLESDKYTYNDAALANTETDLGTNWGPYIQMNSLITDYSSFSAGDIMAISYTTAASYATDTYGQIQIQYNWDEYSNYSSIDANTSGTLYIPVTSDLLTKLDEDNIQIKGQNVTIPANGIQFIHYADVTLAGYRPVYISGAGYATFYGTSTCSLPEGVKAYYVSNTNINTETHSGTAVLTEISNIPANEGVLLKGSAGIYQLRTTTAEAASVSGNLLAGSTTRGATDVTGASRYYKLSYDTSGANLGWYWGADNGGAFTIDAYKAYMGLTAAQAGAVSRFLFEEETDITTDVKEIEDSDKAIKFWQDGQLFIRHGDITYDIMGRIVK